MIGHVLQATRQGKSTKRDTGVLDVTDEKGTFIREWLRRKRPEAAQHFRSAWEGPKHGLPEDHGGGTGVKAGGTVYAQNHEFCCWPPPRLSIPLDGAPEARNQAASSPVT